MIFTSLSLGPHLIPSSLLPASLEKISDSLASPELSSTLMSRQDNVSWYQAEMPQRENTIEKGWTTVRKIGLFWTLYLQ